MEPLELGVLAGLTPADVECVLYDDRIEAIPYDEPTDLAAITVEIHTARRAYEIAAEFRSRGIPVIMGGFHATLAPQECILHADSVYIGDAEALWAHAVEDARSGRLRRFYKAPFGVPQGGRVRPRRDLFQGKGYLPIALVQFMRGCRYACNFCAISAYFSRQQRARPVLDVIEEVEALDGRTVFFVDDNFLADPDAVKPFLRELIPLKIRWVSQASIEMANDPELMDLVEASGCIGTVTGFESLDPRNLRAMKKAPNLLGKTWDRYQRQIEVLRSHHLQTWAAFTLGHDHDTIESIRNVLDFAIENKFCLAGFNILLPYPGTPLYDRLHREHRLLWNGQWWLHPAYRFNHAAFLPKNMSPDELTEVCWECRAKWNSARSIVGRMLDVKTHLHSPVRLGFYLYYNQLYAREIKTKQGMRFGWFDDKVVPHDRILARG
ncbi:MAG: radical SAM protein [Alphaproteobacteria bacterium]